MVAEIFKDLTRSKRRCKVECGGRHFASQATSVKPRCLFSVAYFRYPESRLALKSNCIPISTGAFRRRSKRMTAAGRDLDSDIRILERSRDGDQQG